MDNVRLHKTPDVKQALFKNFILLRSIEKLFALIKARLHGKTIINPELSIEKCKSSCPENDYSSQYKNFYRNMKV